jgi:N-acetylglucosamine-6-sulfatase
MWVFEFRLPNGSRAVSQVGRVVLLIAGLSCSDAPSNGVAPPSAPSSAAVVGPPNIIFILSDDEDVGLHAFLPKTKALLHDKGTTLTNFFVTYSLCCPSRASILRGQYPHNTLVESNAPPGGGYVRFKTLGREQATIGTWLQQAGYRTVFIGKYMNGYDISTAGPAPPGWSQWNAVLQDSTLNGGYNYRMDEDGAIVSYGSAPADFLTDVIARKATTAIRQAALDGVPIFLYLAPVSPHLPAGWAPRHSGLFTAAPLPISPNYNEKNVSDKPAPIRSLPLIGSTALSNLTSDYRDRLRALQSVDDLVDSVVTTLRSTRVLDKTWIFYTSDNGFHMGAHRSRTGKNLPYEEDLRVPFVVRGPRVPKGAVVPEMGLNIDLAPTFAQIAGATPTVPQDGRSLLPLLTGAATGWRLSFQSERGAQDFAWISSREGELHPQLELGDVAAAGSPGLGWNAIRTSRWKYVEWANGDRELYDLNADPFELTNRFHIGDTLNAPPLMMRLHQLMTCAGAQCAAVENMPVP